MRKIALAGAVVAGLVLACSAVRNLWALFQVDRERATKVEAEAADLGHQRDSLVAVVDERDRLIAGLGLRSDTLESAAQAWRDSVNVLEQKREATQLAVRETEALPALRDELRKAFPELGDSAWAITTIPAGIGDTLGIQYLMIPAWFAETFVIEHANAEAWREQKDRLVTADSLQLVVIALQDSIKRLEASNDTAYASGYRSAYRLSQSVSADYVAQLRKPRFKLGSSLGFLAGAGLGLIVGKAIR